MKESIAQKEIDKSVTEVREEIVELVKEFPTEMAVCPYCGSEQLEHVHKKSPKSGLAEFEKDAAEVAKSVQDLHDRYPQTITFCPICGEKL